MCGRYYIAEDDLSDELSRMIDELNRKKTPEGLKTSGGKPPTECPKCGTSHKFAACPVCGCPRPKR